jgi:hypothetical protein
VALVAEKLGARDTKTHEVVDEQTVAAAVADVQVAGAVTRLTSDGHVGTAAELAGVGRKMTVVTGQADVRADLLSRGHGLTTLRAHRTHFLASSCE